MSSDYILVVDYPLNIFSESSIQLNWSGTLSTIEIGVGTAVLLLCTVTAIPYLDVLNIKNKTPIKFATIYFAIMALASVIISMYRLSETGIISDNGICKRVEGDLVCPTVLFRSAMKIENKEDCVFNAFANSASVWNRAGVPKINWYDKDMYDKKSQQTVYDAYKAAREDVEITADEMTLYHDCWYWGCDEVCNYRHTININMAFASAIVSVIYIVLAVLSGVQSEFDYKEVETSIPNQGSSSDSKGTPSESKIKSWNFNLRM